MRGIVQLSRSFYSKTDPSPGIKFQESHRAQDNIRIQKGRGRDAYVKITSNGQVLGKDGGIIKKTDEYPSPKNHPNAHISLSDWIQWSEWNKK